MHALGPIRQVAPRAAGLVLVGVAMMAHGQTLSTGTAAEVLDRVVAVVNNRAILWSDVTDELRFSVLDPEAANGNTLTAQKALQLLISRALIQQQIRQEDASTTQPTSDEVQARLKELRKELPACVRMNCASEEGWQNFLKAHGLTPDQIETYLRLRLEILRFIEIRFRQGIRIAPQEIETYYKDKLLPQYAKGATVPPLTEVSPRIEEILLEEQVNVMFSSWLDNLRKQGDVEVLDPTLESGTDSTAGSEGP
jgi:peptidyl-prolyl cis-trans isomerase SurA